MKTSLTSRPAAFLLSAALLTGLSAGLLADGPVAGVRIPDATARAWDQYVTAVEARRTPPVDGVRPFLVIDQQPAGSAVRERLLQGTPYIAKRDAERADGRSIDVPDARVHHWLGAVFLPRVSVEGLLKVLESGPPAQADVLRATVLERGPDELRVFLKLQRTKIVTVVFDTEHLVRFSRLSPSRAASVSVATAIRELRGANTAAETALAPGADHGYLWRLHAYWRYEAVAGGVIAECESISLSRDIPFGFGVLVGPFVDSAARQSMESALAAIRDDSRLVRP